MKHVRTRKRNYKSDLLIGLFQFSFTYVIGRENLHHPLNQSDWKHCKFVDQ